MFLLNFSYKFDNSKIICASCTRTATHKLSNFNLKKKTLENTEGPIQRKWQHRVHKTKTNKTKTHTPNRQNKIQTHTIHKTQTLTASD